MVKYGFVAAERAGAIVNAQGVFVKRPSRIHVKVTSTKGEITQVKVGGVSVIVGEGTASVSRGSPGRAEERIGCELRG